MSEDRSNLERRDEWALADLDAAVGIVGATVGAAFGPLGSILGGFIGPYAKLAVTRFMELRTRVAEEVELNDDELLRRLKESEPLAQMMAEVVRGTVESDLEAKRRLLARAAIRALQDVAVVDEEAVIVRSASALSAVDVRVLALIRNAKRTAVSEEYIKYTWPEIALVFAPAISALEGAGLVVMIPEAGEEAGDDITLTWTVTRWGGVLLDRLLEEGLEDELQRRSGEEESA